MRLTQVVPSLEARYGGPSRSVLALSGALARAGHDVELLATDPGAGEERVEGPLRVKIFHRDWPQRLCPSASLRAALNTRSADVVHHHSIWLRTLHYAHRAALAQGARFVISPRGMMSRWAWGHRDWRKKIGRALVHPGAFEAVHGWHATSAEEADEIRALGFNQPVCVAPNAVDAPESAESAAAAAHWHALCPATAQRPVALFYSRFHQKKRVIDLIDLWLAHGPRDWLLLLVGIPQDYTPAMLEQYVLRQSGSGRVQAFDGTGQPVPYPVASLFLLPSHNENFGLVVAEAMAHGVPALVTDTTPWRGLNTDARGWCVAWDDYPAALRAAVAEGPAALRARGGRAREWVLREYSWDKSARELASFYAQLRKGSA
ncbi:MAG: glycosyltransferase [Verrucomicrobia bacterium]|nr:glycosyltransferase [Verrucomicrobiota bacterium]